MPRTREDDDLTMTPPDLPAELQGRARRETARSVAERRSRTRRADLKDLPRWRQLRRDQLRGRCAGLCAGADARDLCRGDCKPERAWRAAGRTSRRQACSMSAPDRAPRAGPRPRHFPRCEVLRCWTPMPPCARWRSISAATACACSEMTYHRGEARARWPMPEPADLVVASYVIGEIGEAERRALAELLWTKTSDTLLIVEPGTPAGHAQGHRAAAATDRIRRACHSPLPARRRVSPCGAGLVSFHPTPAALARAHADQGR